MRLNCILNCVITHDPSLDLRGVLRVIVIVLVELMANIYTWHSIPPLLSGLNEIIK